MAFILIVEGDAKVSERAVDALMAAGHSCGWVSDPDQARTLLRRRDPELILIDREMAGACAEALIERREPHRRDIPMIMLSGAGGGTAEAAHGAQDCIRKPFDPHFLVWRVDHVLNATRRGCVVR